MCHSHQSNVMQAIETLTVSMGARSNVDPQIKRVMEQHCSLSLCSDSSGLTVVCQATRTPTSTPGAS